jgi:hypothetical protein
MRWRRWPRWALLVLSVIGVVADLAGVHLNRFPLAALDLAALVLVTLDLRRRL